MAQRSVDPRAPRGAKRRPSTREEAGEPEPSARIYAVVRAIPRGKVATYGQVALLAGIPSGHRVAARAMRECPEQLPWYRVLAKKDARRAKIALGDPEHAQLQERRLRAEGVRFAADGSIPLREFGWLPVEASSPAGGGVRSTALKRSSRSSQMRANRAPDAAAPRRNR